ncbi:hypothetical protein [Bauldia sp.]|uniref:hypothetical protein n=1 Tax=Bauldia sp. TaxID=2575872 RepID=UPI003BAD9DB3
MQLVRSILLALALGFALVAGGSIGLASEEAERDYKNLHCASSSCEFEEQIRGGGSTEFDYHCLN